jgi:hypothetical protein
MFDPDDENFRIENFEFVDCPGLDFKNQSCHGLVSSKNGAIWALLQNGGLDNARPRGKVN